jgi:Bacterial PH domain
MPANPRQRQRRRRWQHERVSPVRFRRSSAITLAAVVFMIAGLSVVRWAPYLLILLVIPAAVAVWSWRSGTDADRAGLTVRALLGNRRIPWSDVAGLVTDERGNVSAQLSSGRAVPLPAVGRADLPRLVEAAGQDLNPR